MPGMIVPSMKSRWDDVEAQQQPEMEGLLYASRLVGADEQLVLWGGGNTSAKLEETDFRGRPARVLRIKGSGSDLKTIRREQFPGVRMEDALPLRERTAMDDAEMVAYLAQTLLEPGSPRPSIETLLHAFLPARFVVHTHADAILALTNTSRGPDLVREALGAQAVWVDYRRPGFTLSKLVGEAQDAHPDASCIVLAKHGLVTWGETAREAYERTIDLVTQAEGFVAGKRSVNEALEPESLSVQDSEARRLVFASLAPLIRGLAARTLPDGTVASPWADSRPLEMATAGRLVLLFDDSEEVLAFASDPAAAQLSQIGPATPDHLISTRRIALYVPAQADGGGLEGALDSAWRAWTAEYVRYVRGGGEIGETDAPETVDARPRVVLLPGVGMVTLGKDPRAARVASDIYRHAIATIRAAETVDRYESLTPRECFDVEYWPMELYRLTLLPAEQELARRIVLVTGAASGIGRAIAERLAQDGACVAISDVNLNGAQAVAGALNRRHGDGRAIAVRANVAEEVDVERLFRETVVAFGGLDCVVSNAGIAPYGLLDEMDVADWQRSLDVNATGHFLVTRHALRWFKRQGIGGSMIFVATKNVMAPGREFGAYSAAKAAQAQLARITALEGGEFGIRANMINPDAVFRGSTLWSPELRRARAEAHGTDDAGLEDYYQKRNLLALPIYGEDVAEAAWWLASERSRKTTGTVITVDGGVAAAFPR